MNSRPEKVLVKQIVLPLLVLLLAMIVWWVLALKKVYPESAFPTPSQVFDGFMEEGKRGRLFDDIIASLFRVSSGFLLATGLGIPLGLLLGLRLHARYALLPAVNFLRNLSPLAWIPFAILWFGIGDAPAVFLIFMASFPPIILTTMVAVAHIPEVYFKVARDYSMKGMELLTQVIIPAILPQILTALRVTAGLAWVVVVAAELIAGRDGLGFLIWDARNALRPDLVVVGMVIIGAFGVLTDRLLAQLTRIPSVRWSYER
ncbi:MAG: ABC transporter permease [Armatimonas sp.]